jgi:hypothetical protein
MKLRIVVKLRIVEVAWNKTPGFEGFNFFVIDEGGELLLAYKTLEEARSAVERETERLEWLQSAT